MDRPPLDNRHTPPWAPSVVGAYSTRAHEDDDLHWQATCTTCGETFGPTKCTSGLVVPRIEWFARSHTHGAAAPVSGIEAHIRALETRLHALADAHEAAAAHPSLADHAGAFAAEAARARMAALTVGDEVRQQMADRARQLRESKTRG